MMQTRIKKRVKNENTFQDFKDSGKSYDIINTNCHLKQLIKFELFKFCNTSLTTFFRQWHVLI